MPTVTLTIDGKQVSVEQGTTILRAAERVGIHIPRFCFHPGLSIAGNCRICLVEVEKMPKLITSCSTVVSEGMVVHTNNENVQRARRGVLELMLSNHPLDCPICDQAGECALQDYYMTIGLHKSRFMFPKYHKAKGVKLPPHLVLDAERCILCSRCVRFCQEVTKTNEFNIGWRGNHAEIDTFEHRGLENGYVGNLHEICPVGALTSLDFRFKSRSWWLKGHPSVCPGCSTGCNIYIDETQGEVYRLRARENQAVNRYWLCDEGRYNYKFINAENRVTVVRVKIREQMRQTPWNKALETVHAQLSEIVGGGGKVAGIASAQMTNEEIFLFKKYIGEVLGSDTFDFRIDGSWADVEKQVDALLLRGDKNPNTRGAEAIGLKGEKEVQEILQAATDGEVGALYIVGAERLAAAGLSDAVKAAREGVEYIVMHASSECDILDLADALLPASTFAEKEGTFTNYQGRVQRIWRAIPAVGNSKADLDIFAGLLVKAGQSEFASADARKLFNMMAAEVQPFAGLTYDGVPPEGALISGEAGNG
jgi:NADH-quinone oxidoreductase subunit G